MTPEHAPLSIKLPLRIVSTMNLREHHYARARRAREQRGIVALVLRQRARPLVGALVVTLTRIAPRALDSDNLAAGFKAVRDGVADALAIDDADPRVEWKYAQERGKAREYAARIEIEAKGERAA